MELKKRGHAVLEDPDGQMVEVTDEQPRGTWSPGQNPFAGREPLAFQARGR